MTPLTWDRVFRDGFCPQWCDAVLLCLKNALASRDDRLCLTHTTLPYLDPDSANEDTTVVAACPVAFCGWIGEGVNELGALEDWFAGCCLQADVTLGDPHASRIFIDWLDTVPREVALYEMLQVVNAVLAERRSLCFVPALS